MNEKHERAAAASISEGRINRRDALKLAAAAMAATLLPQTSLGKPLSDSSQSQSKHSENKEKLMSSYIKVGRENSTPIELTTRTMGPDRRWSSFTVGR
jgi:hypothetical protein